MFLIALLATVIVFLLCLAIYNYANKNTIKVSQRMQRIAQANRRAAVLKHNGGFWDDFTNSPVSTWAKAGADRFASFFPREGWFNLHVQQAGLPISGAEYITLIVGSAFFWAFLVFLGSFKITVALAYFVGWLLVTSIYLKWKAAKRMQAFSNQLGDGIVMMSNAIKAGFTFQQAMDIVAKEMPDPISTEFARAINEVQLGVTLEDALNNICKRVNNDDFDLICMAVVIQRQVGGNLSRILDNVGTTIRDRIKLKGEIKALTAEGILSGWVIGLLPILVGAFCYAMNPHYFDDMLKKDFGRYMIAGCAVSEIIGGFIISRIVKVRI